MVKSGDMGAICSVFFLCLVYHMADTDNKKTFRREGRFRNCLLTSLPLCLATVGQIVATVA